jgi:hypothetical protein
MSSGDTPRMTDAPSGRTLLAIAALALGMCGCATTPSGSIVTSPSQSTQGTDQPSPSGTVPSISPPPVADGELMIVVADQVNLRSSPGTDAAPVGVLPRGTVVRTIGQPAEANGFTWRKVVDITDHEGWAAEGDGADPWLASIAPTAPAAAALAFDYACDVSGPFPTTTTILDDARVVFADPDQAPGWTVRRLSASGMAHVRTNVLESPLLQTNANHVPVLRAGVSDPPGHGACTYVFTLDTGADPIVVQTVGWFGDDEEAAFYEPSPERKALDGMARNLMRIDLVLDDSAWEAAAWLPYVADSYLVWIGPGIGPAPDDVLPLDGPLPIGATEAFGQPSGEGRCGAITREIAFELARTLNRTIAPSVLRMHEPAFTAYRVEGGWMTVEFVPLTPDGRPTCDHVGGG